MLVKYVVAGTRLAVIPVALSHILFHVLLVYLPEIFEYWTKVPNYLIVPMLNTGIFWNINSYQTIFEPIM